MNGFSCSNELKHCKEEEELREGKLSRYRCEGAEGKKTYSSYTFLTSAMDGVECSGLRPGHALPPGKDPW
jgi:hypothetical protein